MPYHARAERFACIVAHRRAGKTVACVNELIKAAILCDKPEGRFAYIAPLFNQSKDVAWAYLKRYAAPCLAAPPNESELRVDLVNGARIRLYGADNPDRLRGIYLDGCVLDEYADMHPGVWGEVVRPALADRQGWATFIGTPKGRNAFWELFDRSKSVGWFSLMLRASETGIVLQSELDAAKADMTPEQYEQEFECSFDAAIMGAYYGRYLADAEREGRVGEYPYNPEYPVHTAIDIGVRDQTAVWWFQVIGKTLRIIDHYEAVGMNAAHYVAQINSKPYNKGTLYVPHDGAQRSWTAGDVPGLAKQRIETLVALKANPKMVPIHEVMDGINAARMLFPRMYFHEPACAQGIEALRQYRAEYDEKTRAFRLKPKHDWTSHTADAFRYLAMAYREIVPPSPPPKPVWEWEVDKGGQALKSNITIADMIRAKERARRREAD